MMRIRAGSCSQRCVLPSMSVKRNVTVPLGISRIPLPTSSLSVPPTSPISIAGPRDRRKTGLTPCPLSIAHKFVLAIGSHGDGEGEQPKIEHHLIDEPWH